MAILYVNDGGSNTSPFDTWAKAATTLKAALDDAACVAGSTVYVDSTHAETDAASKYLTNSGTNLAPIIIISVDATGSPEPPTTGDYLAGASIAPTGTSNDIVFYTHARSYGVDYISPDQFFGQADTTWSWFDCTVGLSTNSSNDKMQFQYDDSRWHFDGCTFTFANSGQGLQIGGGSSVRIKNCDLTGTATTQFISNSDYTRGTNLEIDNCDFSAMSASSPEIFATMPHNSGGPGSSFRVSNCLLKAGCVITSDTLDTEGTLLEAYNCSSTTDDDATFAYHANPFGTAQNDTANYLDATNAFSHAVTCNASAVPAFNAMRFMLGEVYAAAGATIGVKGVIDTTIPKNDELWIEVIYPPVTAGNSSRRLRATTLLGHNSEVGWPDLTAANADVATDTQTWTSPDVATDVDFQVNIDLSSTGDVTTDSGAGVVQVWVNFAKASTTCYVDSKIVVS